MIDCGQLHYTQENKLKSSLGLMPLLAHVNRKTYIPTKISQRSFQFFHISPPPIGFFTLWLYFSLGLWGSHNVYFCLRPGKSKENVRMLLLLLTAMPWKTTPYHVRSYRDNAN